MGELFNAIGRVLQRLNLDPLHELPRVVEEVSKDGNAS